MPKFDGQEVTRRQLLARLAWHEGNYGWDEARDDFKPRTYIEQQMDGSLGYHDMDDESLVQELEFKMGVDQNEGYRIESPDWSQVDAEYENWGNEPERTDQQKILCAISHKIVNWAPDALMTVLRFVNGSPDEQLDAVDRVSPLTDDDMQAYGLDPGLRG